MSFSYKQIRVNFNNLKVLARTAVTTEPLVGEGLF